METWNALQISCISTQQMSSIYIKHGICNSKKMIWKEFRGMNLCMKYGSMFCFVFLIEFSQTTMLYAAFLVSLENSQ